MNDAYDYVIVGGGMTADAAAKGIRENDGTGSIGIFGEDVDQPYTRPALSKKLWTDPQFTPDDNWLNTADETGADIALKTHVAQLDPTGRTITTDAGKRINYGRLLLAQGCTPNTLEHAPSDKVIYFRSFADYRRLREFSGRSLHIAVVGGGYIGIELAAALVQNDTQVTMIFPDQILGGSQFPDAVACRLHRTYDEHEVTLAAGRSVEDIAERGSHVELTLDSGETIDADAAVVGLGVTPNTDLAEHAGIVVEDGITVDARLMTSAPDIYAAGDIASYPDRILGRRRVEHVDNATQMGAAAGRIMSGSSERYDHTPYFYSNVFDIGYEAVGTLDAHMPIVDDWLGDDRCVAYYLGDDAVEGVLLWNVDERRDAARAALGRPRQAELRGLIS
ncbi:NAD(P)/FAD-dependent oxidoreductase [Spelaeicoccus albus]|uniref:NADPH-dependent 2,4-dienoyl-CoA reductase/sulfur reductase-like enzyme n=1 Tax=Spelaeicoccus albus TaxID=1280376 RepID=A0A7Z0D4J0_9MICO|nr:FAD/NAD(P)-binding oxidoreductase [Spelaeicoccus albus]NYI68743.1 NADPH-dependent 2,4-dienoyl-CoA reductase/sulfur reductase-like enzyme [Spelaeicoccus albus]